MRCLNIRTDENPPDPGEILEKVTKVRHKREVRDFPGKDVFYETLKEDDGINACHRYDAGYDSDSIRGRR